MNILWSQIRYALPRLNTITLKIVHSRPLSSTASAWLTNVPPEKGGQERDIPLSSSNPSVKTEKPEVSGDTSTSSSSSDSSSSSGTSSSSGSSSSSSSSSSSGSSSSSSDSDSEEAGEEKLRFSVLDAALPFVHQFGWSSDAIAKGAESLGYSGMVHGMFTSGGVELVNRFYSICNNKLEEELKKQVTEIESQPDGKIKIRAFIRNAVEMRLRMNLEYIDHWPQAMALHASPTNLSNGLRNIGTTLDHMWYYAGDRSYDFNWYSKRAVLAVVYKSTELSLVQDRSEDFQNTWNFLDRRLSDVQAAGKCFKDADAIRKDVSNIAQAGILTALNILGMNTKSR